MNLLNQSKFKFPLLLFIFLVVFVACVHPISEGMRAQIDPTLTFNQILESPDPHLNQPVMFGGVIVKTKSFDNRTEVEVIQKELDWLGYPSREDKTEGRFIFVKEGFLEPEIYSKGRYVTGAGKMTGNRIGKIDNKNYSFPLIEVAELKLWEDFSRSPYYGIYNGPFYRPYYMFGYGAFGRFRHFGNAGNLGYWW